MPRATRSYKNIELEPTQPQGNNNFNTKVLVIVLIVASYFLGTLTTKVSYLEKNSSSKAVAGDIAQPTAATQPRAPLAPTGKAKPITSSDHIRGNKDAKITLLEFSDLECPFCKSFHPTVQGILNTYGDKVRLVYRHFPLSFHANAQKEAEASECIAQLGGNEAFWSFVDKIFERTTSNGTGFALDKLGPLAAEIGVDQTQFQSCLDSAKFEKLVKDEIADGTSAGVNGTPTTLVMNSKGESQVVVGAQPDTALKTIIDQYLAGK